MKPGAAAVDVHGTMHRSTLILSAALGLGLVSIPASAQTPGWLTLEPGQIARVGAAPWPVGDAPEAALSGSEDTAKVAAEDYATRPADAIHESIGVRVTIERIYNDKVVRVRLDGVAWTAYTRIDRLVPEIPPGTRLVVSGGFGNYADFYPALDTPAAQAKHVATGTPLVALEVGIARYDPQSSDFVRVRVTVRGGPLKGRTGWIPVPYTGVPAPNGNPSSTAERACRCRLVEFR